MPLAAGKLDRRIRIERFTSTTGELGGEIKAWTTLATRWASYEPLSDGERFRAGETAATATARFVIRHSAEVADVGPLDRVVFKGVVYEIVHAKETGGRGVGIELTCKARADG